MQPALIVGLVVGVLVIGAAIAVWARQRNARVTALLLAQIEANGERILLGPMTARYAGAKGVYGKVQGAGTAVLTDRRLVFRKFAGGFIEVRLTDVGSVRELQSDIAPAREARDIVIDTDAGEEARFLFADHDGWKSAVQRAVADAVEHERRTQRA